MKTPRSNRNVTLHPRPGFVKKMPATPLSTQNSVPQMTLEQFLEFQNYLADNPGAVKVTKPAAAPKNPRNTLK
jgi:hypothetical protein